MNRIRISMAVLGGCWLLAGCGPNGGTYCQSGPKYGTQCYSQMDLQPPGSPPPRPDGQPRR